MNEQIAVPVKVADFLELAEFLRSNGDPRGPVEVVTTAIQYWMENAEWKREDLMPEALESRGYTWKYKEASVFLPDGTQVRMRYKGRYHYAAVKGDEIYFNGELHTPATLANTITQTEKGPGSRNAWRDLWIKRPNETEWHLADDLRNKAKAAAKFFEDL